MQNRFIHCVNQLPSKLANAITPILNESFSGHISKTQIEELIRVTNLTESELLLSILPIAAAMASPFISQFYVGAIAKCDSGDIYMGANMELPSEALCHSIHAEQSAISHAWLAGESCITDLIVNYSPCGHCRQFINELAIDINIHLPGQQPQPLSHYLPYAFGPKDLHIDTPLLQDNGQALLIDTQDPFLLETLDQASKSYSPYTQCHSAVGIKMKNGCYYFGRYAENAAFNPSMMPMQMAWANMVRHNETVENIERVVLVESSLGKISLLNETHTALANISQVSLEHIVAIPLP